MNISDELVLYVNEQSTKALELQQRNRNLTIENEHLSTKFSKATEDYSLTKGNVDDLLARKSYLESEVKELSRQKELLVNEIDSKNKALVEICQEALRVNEKLGQLCLQEEALVKGNDEKTKELTKREEIIGNNEATLKSIEEELKLREALLAKKEEILVLTQRGI